MIDRIRRRLLRTHPVYRLRPWWRHERDALVLHSIEKCGTNMVRLFIANYIAFLDGRREPVSYAEMAEWFPNVRSRIVNREGPFRQPSGPAAVLNYSDFVYTHSPVLLDRSPARTLLHVYRNPLDQIVSAWHYFDRGRGKDTPLDADYAARRARMFARSYVAVRDLRRAVSRFSYERLWNDPYAGFSEVAVVVGANSVDDAAVRFAIDAASLKRVREEETATGRPVHGAPGFTGSFVRSGQVGQWRTSLPVTAVHAARRTLTDAGVDLDDFDFGVP